MKTNYADYYEQTIKTMGDYAKASPEMMPAFMKCHHVGTSDGALQSKHKELIALGISIHTKCEGCIVTHIYDALKAGATQDEIVETIDVAVFMGGGPAVIYGSKAYNVLREFEEKNFVK